MTTVKECVAKGVALLDERRPGWDSRMDLSTFNIWDGECCILGQVYGNYTAGVARLKLNFETTVMDYGFNAPYTNARAKATRMEELRAEWIRVITDRRAPR